MAKDADKKDDNNYQTYGLYNATFRRTVAAGSSVKQESWKGKMPTNVKSGGSNKYKK